MQLVKTTATADVFF